MTSDATRGTPDADARGTARTAPVGMTVQVRADLIAHARREAPRECCGLLVGSAARIDECVPLPNIASTPLTRYEIDPAGHIATRRRLRGTDRDVVGAYHSHPTSPAVPSATDLADAQFPDFVWIIVSLADSHHPAIAAYRLADGQPSPLDVMIDDEHT